MITTGVVRPKATVLSRSTSHNNLSALSKVPPEASAAITVAVHASSPLELAAAELKAREAEHHLYCAELTAFKRTHMKVVNGSLVYLVSDLKSRPALDAELMYLVRRVTRAWRNHQIAMREYAQVKTGSPL